MEFEIRELFAVGCNAVVFNKKSEVLLLKRSNSPAYRPNLWDLPGGKVEKNETPEIAIVRETFEETGLKIDLLRPFDFELLKKPTCNFPVLSIKFIAICNEESVSLSVEHDKFIWNNTNNLPNDLGYNIKNVVLTAAKFLGFWQNSYAGQSNGTSI
jgi:8-oxo-dGTP diphosphatase